MKGESADQVAERMRAIAASTSNKDDAAEIARYANFLQWKRADDLEDESTVFCSSPALSPRKSGQDDI